LLNGEKEEKMSIIFSTQPVDFDIKSTIEAKQQAAEIAPSKAEVFDEEFETESRHAILKETLAQHEISLKISKDENTGQIVVKLIDDKTGEEVQQFPTEASLKLSEIFTKIQGQFVEKRV
jgi:uncharacterized FlaG/YvyC family protein